MFNSCHVHCVIRTVLKRTIQASKTLFYIFKCGLAALVSTMEQLLFAAHCRKFHAKVFFLIYDHLNLTQMDAKCESSI